MKVVPVVGLSAVVAFKDKEIQVNAQTFETVPADKREDFEVVLNEAKMIYNGRVADAKAKGEKPKAMQIKSDVVHQVINSWLDKVGVVISARPEGKVVTSKNPRIPAESEKVEITPVAVIDKEAVKDFYDDFPTESLSDAAPITDEKPVEDLFLGEEDMFGDGIVVTSMDKKVAEEDVFGGIEIPSFEELGFADK